MTSDWHRHEVRALISTGKLIIGDGYRAKNEELSSAGLPFARVGNVNGGFHFEDADRFPLEELWRVGNKISEPGDVVFTSKGTVGRFAFVRHYTPRFVYSPQLCFWRSLDRKVIEPRFLFYWMQGREFYVQFNGVAGQTDMAEYVSLADQRGMYITLPDPSEQRVITHILSALDDKIELNRRMNETLEAMARAVFKSWFVDFLPVRAKIAARTQTGDPVRAKLALSKAEGAGGRLPAPRPDTFYVYVIECDNGSHYIGQTDDLQRRWEDHKAGKVEWTKRHKPVKVAHYEEFPTRQEAVKRESNLKTGFGRKWLKKLISEGRARQAGQPFGMDAATALSACDAQVDALFPDSFQDSPLGKIPKGWNVGRLDSLILLQRGFDLPTVNRGAGPYPVISASGPSGTHAEFRAKGPGVVTGRSGLLGRVFFVHEDFWPLNTTLWVKQFRGIGPVYAFHLMRRMDFDQFNAGSAVPTLNRNHVHNLPVVIPPREVMDRFEELVLQMFRKCRQNTLESQTLAAIRDALLPKLISGEIRVRNIRTLAEAFPGEI